MPATPVTPTAGMNSIVLTGGTSVVAAAGGFSGGYITNPLLAADQNISTAEPLIIDPTGASPGLSANGTAVAIQPGQTWDFIPGQMTATSVNAATSGHKFTVVVWL